MTSGCSAPPAVTDGGVVARMSDPQLVTAVQRHQHQALAELYRRHGGALFTLALRVLRVRELAEEVVQDIFARLWHSPERFDPARGTLRPYLLAQAHRRAIDVVRSESARRARDERAANAVSPAYVLEDDALNLTVGDQVREAMTTLSADQQRAISLAYFGGHSYREVAVILHEPEGTVKSRIHTGLARLRRTLADAGIASSQP